MKYKSVRGMEDILPSKTALWRGVENTARAVFASFGYQEIILPIVETTEVFTRTLGDDSDIVNKEMYTFLDRKERSLTLRPEGTASVVRAVIEHNLLKSGNPVKLFYTGPMFRYERPQLGRKRQFYQMGVEFFGSSSVYADCDAAICMAEIFKKLKLPVVLRINTLGCQKCSRNYTEYVKESLNADKHVMESLCRDCIRRMNSNVLRIFDCKNSDCQKIMKNLMPIGDSVCEEDKKAFNIFKEKLEQHNILHEVNKSLVRGLDYYTGIVYEVYIKGSHREAIAGGGRYDNLVKVMGGVDMPAVGFAIGIDRLVEFADQNCGQERPHVFLVSIGEKALDENFRFLIHLRKKGISAQMEYEDKSPKAQFRRANALNCPFVIVRGDEEMKKNIVKIKHMADGKESELKEEEAFKIVNKELYLK